MLFYPTEKLALFVDGANLYGAAKGLGFDIDYKKMHAAFAKKGILIRASYYTAVADDAEFSPIRPLIDYLEYNGWKMVTKPLKEFTDSQGRLRRKGDMDVDLAVDAMCIAPKVGHLVLCTGDGDFYPLVLALQDMGKRVTVVSTIKTAPPMCSDELRRVADNFMELDTLRSEIERPERGKPHA